MRAPDREDIKAAIRKTGVTCRALGLQHGFSASAVSRALIEPAPAVEAVIAECLGVPPRKLWPARYDREGHPLRGRHGRRTKATAAAALSQHQKDACA